MACRRLHVLRWKPTYTVPPMAVIDYLLLIATHLFQLGWEFNMEGVHLFRGYDDRESRRISSNVLHEGVSFCPCWITVHSYGRHLARCYTRGFVNRDFQPSPWSEKLIWFLLGYYPACCVQRPTFRNACWFRLLGWLKYVCVYIYICIVCYYCG